MKPFCLKSAKTLAFYYFKSLGHEMLHILLLLIRLENYIILFVPISNVTGIFHFSASTKTHFPLHRQNKQASAFRHMEFYSLTFHWNVFIFCC
jgi:hypothetical protein